LTLNWLLKAKEAQSAKFTLSGDFLCVGYDNGNSDSELYPSSSKFNNGKFDFFVTFEGASNTDLEVEIKRVLRSQ
jgi:hypothetical protein